MSHPDRDPFSALSDRTRRSIVERLARGEASVKELAEELPISRPAVSRHLKLLKQAGLVTDRPEGVRRIYSVDDEGVLEVRRYLEQVWGEAMARYRIMSDNTTSVDD